MWAAFLLYHLPKSDGHPAKKRDYREIIGRAEITKKGKKQNVGISVFVVESRLIKSFPTSVFADTCHTSGGNQSYRSDNEFQSSASNLNILYREKISSEKLKQLQKSFQTYLFSKEKHKNDTFAVVVTDVTENNNLSPLGVPRNKSRQNFFIFQRKLLF